MPGRGPLDFGPLMRELAAVHFTGPIQIFMHPVPRGVPILDSIEAITAEVNRARAECRHGPPELVIRREHPVVAVPMLARRWDEIREPVEKLKRRQFDHAVGFRTRGLPPAARADPTFVDCPILQRAMGELRATTAGQSLNAPINRNQSRVAMASRISCRRSRVLVRNGRLCRPCRM